MADIFTLGIKADTTDIDRGVKSLDNLADSSDKAEKSTQELEGEILKLSREMSALISTSNKLSNENKGLAGDVSELSEEMKKNEEQISKLSDELKTAQKEIDDLNKKTKESKNRFADFRKGINAAGLAITAFGVASAAALGVVTVSAGRAAKEIENLSRLSNLTAEEFQRSAFAARAFGVEQDKLSDIFKDVQDKIGDFLKTGGGPLINFFEKVAPMVGVTAEQFRGLSGKEGLQLYVDSLEKANLSQSEMVFFLEEIGNDATLLQPLLADGGKEFERLGQRADDLNVILSDFDLESLRDMNTALREMGAVSEATGNLIGATLAPFVTDLVTKFNDASISGDALRDTVLDLANGGVAVAGVFADAGRVFEIFGLTIAASMFEISQRFDTFEERNELALINYELFGQEMVLATAEWVNDLVLGVIDGVNKVTEALNFGGLLDSVIIEAPKIDTSGFISSISELEAEVLGLEDALMQSNQNIANAWQDVTDLMMQPLPSEGFDKWFKAIRASVEEIRTLQKETGNLDRLTRSSKIGTVAIDWEKQFKKSGETMSALNTIFGKNEKAAKALHKVNEAISLAEAITSIERIINSSIEASTVVANEGIKQSAMATTAIVNQGGGDPFTAFARIAAMTALMASIVGAVSGGNGGSGGNGTGSEGTAFGGGVSESLTKASESMENILIDQLAELRGLRADLGNVESLSAGLLKDLLSVDLGHSEIKNATEEALEDSIRGLNEGVRSGRFTRSLEKIFDGIGGVLDESLDVLGVSTSRSVDNFFFKVSKISFDELDAEQAGQRLNDILSAQSDKMVESVAPFITLYQKLGEGALETLVRVAQEQVLFNDSLDQMGMDLSDLSSVMQIDVAQAIIELIGGVEKFSELTAEFFSEFFTEAEQFDQLTKSLTEAVGGLGLSMFETRDQFRGAVEALDLTTEAGQAMFASLLELVPAMDEFFDSVEASEVEALAEAERLLSEERRMEQDIARELAAEIREEERVAATQAREDARLLAEQQREADKAAKELAASIASLTKSLTAAAKGALSGLAASIKESQSGIAQALGDTLTSIATDFDGQRQSILSRTTNQVASMEMQLGLVNDRVSELAGLSGILSGSLSSLSGSTRGKARADIQAAITTGNAGQDLAGLGLEGAISTLANIDRSSFGSSLELRLEQARTANELSELKAISDGQLTQAEMNAELINKQISAIESSSEFQILTLNELQAQSEELAKENSSEQIEALNDILQSAQDELNAILGVETGVLSLVDAQERFRVSIDALATQISDQAQAAQLAQEQAQTAQAEANASAANVIDDSSTNDKIAMIATASVKTFKLLDRWDGAGQPTMRETQNVKVV